MDFRYTKYMIKTILDSADAILEIKGSKFLSFSYHVDSKSEVTHIIDTLRDKYSDATHICFAYKIGDISISSDDGEPTGTAGTPILGAIDKNGYDHTLVAVARYFGGTKLGASGLIRAYTKAAVNVLNLSGHKDLEKYTQYLVICTYDNAKQVEGIISQYGTNIKSEYSEKVTYTVQCKDTDIENVKIKDCKISRGDTVWV